MMSSMQTRRPVLATVTRQDPCSVRRDLHRRQDEQERVTILVCANMSGSEKLPLLAIGKFKKPRCFRGVTCLPVEYEANRNAWMTAAIFEEWLRKWDEKLGRRGRKIALFVDNCSVHPHISSLNFIELIHNK